VALFATAVTSHLGLVLPLTTFVFLLVLLFGTFVEVREIYGCRSVVTTVSIVVDTASSVGLVVIALLSLAEIVVPLLVLWRAVILYYSPDTWILL
jgi:hypothetical protein